MAQVTQNAPNIQEVSGIPIQWVPSRETGKLKAVPAHSILLAQKPGYIQLASVNGRPGEWVHERSLRATCIPFGKFKGLMLGEIAELEAGEYKLCYELETEQAIVNSWLPPDEVEVNSEIKAISDRDGLNYLDWLLGENWLYPETRKRIEQFMSHPSIVRRLALSMAPKQDGQPILMGESPIPPIEDCMTDKGFSVAGTMDNSKWRTHGQPLWLNTKVGWVDTDPTPWDLRGYEISEDTTDSDDGWKPSLTEEEPFDWTPPREKELDSQSVFSEAVGFLTRLDNIGASATRELEDTVDEFSQVIPGAKSQLETIAQEIKTRFGFKGVWLRTVNLPRVPTPYGWRSPGQIPFPARIKEALVQAILAAKSRLRELEFGPEDKATAALEEHKERLALLAEAIMEDVEIPGHMSVLDTAASLNPRLTLEACREAGILDQQKWMRITRHADTGNRLSEKDNARPAPTAKRKKARQSKRQLVPC